MIRFRVHTEKENKEHCTDVLWLMRSSLGLTPKSHYQLQIILRVYNPKFPFRTLAAGWLDLCRCLRGAITVHTSKARVGVSEGILQGRVLLLLLCRRAVSLYSRTHVVRERLHRVGIVYTHSIRTCVFCFLPDSTDRARMWFNAKFRIKLESLKIRETMAHVEQNIIIS